jgi:hypothetical protein
MVIHSKTNENNDVVRYNTRMVAQGFMQRPNIDLNETISLDFNETHSPVMNGIIFWYLISLTIENHLSLQLMDIVTAYLYGSLDSNIHMKFLYRI